MNYIIYQAYGKTEILQEAVFSILSLLRFRSHTFFPFRIVIYTDNEKYFQAALPKAGFIEYTHLDTATLTDWRGKDDFVHRVKVKMLQHFMENHTGNVLYLDTDTYFLADPLELFNEIALGRRFMHLSEGKISDKSNPIFRKLDRFLRKNAFNCGPGKELKISEDTQMWNAGVLGFRSSDKPLLDYVLCLTDEMYGKYQKHVMEQLAFSYVMQEEGPVKATDKIIYHYWNFKEFRTYIGTFLQESIMLQIGEKAKLTTGFTPWDIEKKHKENKEPTVWQKFLSWFR